MKEEDFEKLGLFYLGRTWDIDQGKLQDDLLLYDSCDLVTHAVCLGMTGSGKTGLCLDLLEEAAIDGIPVIVIDPKGDLSNLLLTFPDLRPEDFQPWVDADEVRRQGLSLQEYARRQADSFKQGLAEWGLSGERVKRLRQAADFAVYTPGSSAGLSVSILKSFGAPPAALVQDKDLLRERIANTTATLLCLLGLEADPLRSKEHILISNIFASAWNQGKDLSLPLLILQIQKPPFTQVGAFDLESFYPAKERFELSMMLNNLLAAPGFESWLEGEPLDIDRFLWTSDSRPRVSIFSIAHLSDAERMFFVCLLLNQLLGWMRAQSGTSSLRALLYMDEIFGYFPPVANPPSKTPLLTLLKQARAFGLGIVLASQNPVDLDYKGLSNTGTWFVGRLQTERDRARVLDGLEGATASAGATFDRQRLDKILCGLGSRIFLMNNVHDSAPTTFKTRSTLSYLRGPLTSEQIKLLRQQKGSARESTVTGQNPSVPQETAVTGQCLALPQQSCSTQGILSRQRPVLPPDVPEYFLPVSAPGLPDSLLLYKAMIIGAADVRLTDAKTKIDFTRDIVLLASVAGEAFQTVNWSGALLLPIDIHQLKESPQENAQFDSPAPCLSQGKSYRRWSKELSAWLYASQELQLVRCPLTKELSRPAESERDFRIRLAQSAREQRDRAAFELKKKYAPRLDSLNERLRKAQQSLEQERLQAQNQELQSAISLGATLVGAFMGRKALTKSTLGRAASTATGLGRAVKERQDVAQASDTVATLLQQLADLDAEFNSEMSALLRKFDPQTATLETISIKPKKNNLAVRLLALIWVPFWQDSQERQTPAWG